MAKDFTYEQERFARLVIKGMSKSDAYRDVFDCSKMQDNSIHVAACKFSKSDKMELRKKELREDQRKLMEYDLTEHIKELEHVHQQCLIPRGKFDTIAPAAAAKCIELKGKVLGMYVEKKEITANITGEFTLFKEKLKKKENLLGDIEKRNPGKDRTKPS